MIYAHVFQLRFVKIIVAETRVASLQMSFILFLCISQFDIV